MLKIEKYKMPQSVLLSEEGCRYPNHGYPAADWLLEGQYDGWHLPPGVVWYQMSDGRIMPVKRAQIDSINGSDVIVQPNWAVLFQVGDTLTTGKYAALATLTGAWDGSETVTFEIAPYPAKSIVLADAGLNTPELAAEYIASKLPAIGYGDLIDPVVDGANLYLVSKRPGVQGEHTVQVVVTGGTGAVTPPAGPSEQIALGTITGVNLETSTLTLDTPVTVPPGLGVSVPQGFDVDALRQGGMRPEETEYDVSMNYGLMVAGNVDFRSLYWDAQLAAAYPGIY